MRKNLKKRIMKKKWSSLLDSINRAKKLNTPESFKRLKNAEKDFINFMENKNVKNK